MIINFFLLGLALLGSIKVFITEAISEQNVLYKYTLSATSNYQVHVIPNMLYPEGVLGEGRLYSRRLANWADITFQAEYTGSLPAEITGSYTINAVVEGYQSTQEQNSVIYERVYPLSAAAPVTTSLSTAGIMDTIVVDLNGYKAFADQADVLIGSRPNRDIRVIFSGNFLAITEHGEVNQPFSHVVTIPLNSEIFSISNPAPFSKTDVIANTKEIGAQVDLFLAGLMFFLIAILLSGLVILLVYARPPTTAEEYSRHFHEIRRKHGSRMIRLTDLPGGFIQNIQMYDIESLVKVSDELQRPIGYVLDQNGLPRQGMLYVSDGVMAYILTLNAPEEKAEGEE